MIIAFPNDGRNFFYHLIDLTGQTVHVYRDFDAALRAREGDQRICLRSAITGHCLTGPPAPAIDYKALLVRYMSRVISIESVAFIDHGVSYDNVEFAGDDLAHLRHIETLARKELE